MLWGEPETVPWYRLAKLYHKLSLRHPFVMSGVEPFQFLTIRTDMSELKKCYCDYIPPQYFATKSLPTVLNVHEVCSSSSEFKPFIEGPKYLINSQA